jgi:hypothetical protein
MMRTLLRYMVLGSFLGLGMGIALTVLGLMVGRLFGEWGRALITPVGYLLSRPIMLLAEADREWGSHLIWENPITTFLLIGIYWMLLGQLCLLIVVPVWKVLRGKEDDESQGGFPLQ